MINVNGNLTDNDLVISAFNRGYNYGDALFETIIFSNGTLLFWEDHYFRLMASMRIMRMEIPMNFTMEFIENEIHKTLENKNLSNITSRIKLIIHRNEGGLYLPNINDVSFVISCKKMEQPLYSLSSKSYEVDLFKDHYVSPSLLSTLKTNNKALHVLASIFSSENSLENCLLINTNKTVVEAINGNLFLVKENVVKTPPLIDGCLNGIMRKQIIQIIKAMPEYRFEESSIQAFELQKADELFLTNVVVGIQPITKYRKKAYAATIASNLIERLKLKVGLSN